MKKTYKPQNIILKIQFSLHKHGNNSKLSCSKEKHGNNYMKNNINAITPKCAKHVAFNPISFYIVAHQNPHKNPPNPSCLNQNFQAEKRQQCK